MPVFLNSITNAENLPLSPAFAPSIMSFPQNSDTKTVCPRQVYLSIHGTNENECYCTIRREIIVSLGTSSPERQRSAVTGHANAHLTSWSFFVFKTSLAPPHGTQTQESRHESTSEPYTWKFHPLHRVECRVEPSRGTVRSTYLTRGLDKTD